MDLFQQGDLVLITKKSTIGDVWVSLMDKTIGQIVKISSESVQLRHRSDAIYVDVYISQIKSKRTWLYPIETLKKIELSDKADTETFLDLMQV